jgi:hypothetical protein
MIETKIYNPPISLISRSLSDGRLELSRLLAAAVINPEFCHLLLDDPELALESGFQGEDFLFTEEERDLICRSALLRWPILPASLRELLLSIYI